ncbi:MAG TPA: hypothetical protein VH583_26335, partial [Vicinamibacterales bacterium]
MRRGILFLGMAAAVAASASCGDVVRDSRAPVILVMESLQGAPSGGHGANTFTGNLLSDVQVLVTTPAPCTPDNPCATVFNDLGQASISMAPKNIDIAPTSNNQVTITRYHVEFARADGHNIPGVDVPFPFDGASTATVPISGVVQISFELVRHTSKEETPLVQLISNPAIIHTIAHVTFYGTDIVGNAVSVTGSMSVDFGNFGD